MGNRSAKLEIQVGQESYQVGDILTGSLVLCVKKKFVCNALTLMIEGREELTVLDFDSARNFKEVFLREELLSEPIQKEYRRGCYQFPFKYALDPTLRGQFTRKGDIGTYGITLHYGFTLVVTMKTGAKCMSTLEISKKITVMKHQVDPVPKSVQESISKPVHAQFQKATIGMCHIAAMMNRDVQIEGQPVQVRWSVKNETSKDISSVCLGLCSIYTSPANIGRRKNLALSHSIIPIRAGASDVFSMDLVLSPWGGAGHLGTLLVTTETSVLTLEFRVIITCHFHRGSSVALEMPLRILPGPG